MTSKDKDMLLNHYRSIIDAMHGHTFYCEDINGVLRRWTPPRRPMMDKQNDGE